MVRTQVEPGAAPDLEKPYRQRESAGENEQPTDQRGGSTHFVGLRRLTEGGAQPVGMIGGGERDVGPCRLGIPLSAGARIPAA